MVHHSLIDPQKYTLPPYFLRSENILIFSTYSIKKSNLKPLYVAWASYITNSICAPYSCKATAILHLPKAKQGEYGELIHVTNSFWEPVTCQTPLEGLGIEMWQGHCLWAVPLHACAAVGSTLSWKLGSLPSLHTVPHEIWAWRPLLVWKIL